MNSIIVQWGVVKSGRNVLRGQAVITVDHYFSHPGKVTVAVKALTPYIIIDQIMMAEDHRTLRISCEIGNSRFN